MKDVEYLRFVKMLLNCIYSPMAWNLAASCIASLIVVTHSILPMMGINKVFVIMSLRIKPHGCTYTWEVNCIAGFRN